MADKIIIKFLPFEITLTLDSTLDQGKRRLELAQNHRHRQSIPSQQQLSPFQRIWSRSTTEESYRSSSNLSVDMTELSSVLRAYFDDYLQREFEQSSTRYAPFSHVSLSSLSRRRILRFADENESGNSMDADDTSFLEAIANENGRFEMDGLFAAESQFEYHDMAIPLQSKSILESNPRSELEINKITPLEKGNLRGTKRFTEVKIITNKYDGVAIFNRSGDLPLPSANTLQAKQLVAQADENKDLLHLMQNAGSATGLNKVRALTMQVSTRNGSPTNGGDATGPNDISGNGNGGDGDVAAPNVLSYDIVIIVAIVVATCSMLLLSFALYLAFRRRHHIPPSSEHPNKEISPVTRKTEQEEDIDPAVGQQLKTPNPPVDEMIMHPQHDDAISDYTESVYSVSRANAMGPNGKREWLSKGSRRSSPKVTGVSSRFNPRYIISSKRSNSSSSVDEHDLIDTRGASQEMEGVPHLTSPMMKQALGKSSNAANGIPGSSMLSPLQASKRDSKPHSQERLRKIPSSYQSKYQTPESGLYPAEVVEKDITSSLSAYTKGNGISKQFKNLLGDKDGDGESLISCESYGFSLDGVGDQDTAAASTTYGY